MERDASQVAQTEEEQLGVHPERTLLQENRGLREQDKWHTPLTRPIKFAKYLAMALFVVLPFVGFWLGVEYGARVVAEQFWSEDPSVSWSPVCDPGDTCCEASVEAAYNAGGYFLDAFGDEQCPEGYMVNMMKCPTSYRWCELATDVDRMSDERDVADFACGSSIVQDADGHEYKTVRVGVQCWMAENLRVGTMLQRTERQTNNKVVEKYCYEDTEEHCDTDSGLYTWQEAMQYIDTPGAQGICPDGWHVPTDAEWHVLESAFADASSTCDSERVFAHHSNNPHMGCAPAGTALKVGGDSGLDIPLAGTTNMIGEGWPGMPSYWEQSYVNRGKTAALWASSPVGSRTLFYDDVRVGREDDVNGVASVRCVKDAAL